MTRARDIGASYRHSGGRWKALSNPRGTYACSTIRKIVRFDLQPGVYRLYLTGLDKPAAKVMLVAPE